MVLRDALRGGYRNTDPMFHLAYLPRTPWMAIVDYSMQAKSAFVDGKVVKEGMGRKGPHMELIGSERCLTLM